jgi:hypothetical protein
MPNANHLEIQGANPFRVRADRNAMRRQCSRLQLTVKRISRLREP